MEMKRIAPEREEMRARVTFGGHPVHAILTDFPIVCFILSFIWNLVAIIANSQPWYAMTFWTMLAGLVMVVPTALTGLLDFTKVLQRNHPGSRTATFHLIANVTATLFFLLSLLLRRGTGILTGPSKSATFILAAVGVVILLAGGYLGGRLVYHHGIGVSSEADDRE
jgi:uncharacterized membrane protein